MYVNRLNFSLVFFVIFTNAHDVNITEWVDHITNHFLEPFYIIEYAESEKDAYKAQSMDETINYSYDGTTTELFTEFTSEAESSLFNLDTTLSSTMESSSLSAMESSPLSTFDSSSQPTMGSSTGDSSSLIYDTESSSVWKSEPESSTLSDSESSNSDTSELVTESTYFIDTSSFKSDQSSTMESDAQSLTFDSSTRSYTTEKSHYDEIMEMTTNYHKMRVTLVNYTHAIQAQQRTIIKLEKFVRELETKVSQNKAENKIEMRNLMEQNEHCRVDFNRILRDLKTAKKLIGMESYSNGLRKKLSEFGINTNSTL